MRELAVWGILLVLVLIYRRLGRIYRFLRRKQEPTPTGRIRFYIDGREVIGMANIKVTETKTGSIVISDAHGNPAQVDGAPVWSLTDPSLATLTPAADGMSCAIAPVGPIGTCELQVKADADLGAGVVDILGTLPLEFIAGDAVTVQVSIA